MMASTQSGHSDQTQTGKHEYREDPKLPGYWFYGDLRIQADVETHRFVAAYARKHCAPGTRVLDVAAGEGALTQQLLDAGCDVTCTSWNDKCRAGVPTFKVDLDAPFTVDDVGGRPFPLICAVEIIEHLENPAGMLRHCAGLLEPDGRLILSTPNVESAEARLQWLVRGRPAIFSGEEIRMNRHIALPWREGLEHLIQGAGLRVVEKHLVGRFRVSRSPLGILKTGVYKAMAHLLPGDLEGTTRLYVLALSESGAVKHGATEVF